MKMTLHFQFQNIVTLLFILDFQQARIKAIPPPPAEGTDCTEILANDEFSPSRAYLLKPAKSNELFEAYCEMQDGGWTVIQRRHGTGPDGNPVNFVRDWSEYKRGFGNVNYEYWLGLKHVHDLSQQDDKTCQLQIDMISCQEEEGFAFYDWFRIGSEEELYSIHLGNYTGFTGDAFRGIIHSGTQNHHPFSTFDNDNDRCEPCISGNIESNSCANKHSSAWWFSNCGLADLNGMWHPKTDCAGWTSGIYWKTWRSNSLLSTVLKIRCRTNLNHAK